MAELLALPAELLHAILCLAGPCAAVFFGRTCRDARDFVRDLARRGHLLRDRQAVVALLALPEYRRRWGKLCARALLSLPVHPRYEAYALATPSSKLSWQMVRRYVPLPGNGLSMVKGAPAEQKVIAALERAFLPALHPARVSSTFISLFLIHSYLAEVEPSLAELTSRVGAIGTSADTADACEISPLNSIIFRIVVLWLWCTNAAGSTYHPH
jgi:hypothetical protein